MLEITDWIQAHHTAIWWLVATSAVTFVASLIAVPLLLVRMPADYFVPGRHERPLRANLHPVLRTASNLLGVVLVAAGIVMLILPGQGILAIFAGLMRLDFPGKRRAERWIVGRPPVLRSINWLRKRGRCPPLRGL